MEFRIVNSELVYQGFFKLTRLQLEHRLFSGAMSAVLSRELFDRGDAVSLLPYDPFTDTVLLVEQFRMGAQDDPRGPWLIEPIAGMVESGEQPQAVAVREAQEEAGLELGELIPVAEYYCSPGGCNEKIYMYCAQADLSQTFHHAVHGLQAEGEDIRVHLMQVSELEARLHAGEFNTAMTLIAVQWLLLNRSRLRDRWLTGKRHIKAEGAISYHYANDADAERSVKKMMGKYRVALDILKDR